MALPGAIPWIIENSLPGGPSPALDPEFKSMCPGPGQASEAAASAGATPAVSCAHTGKRMLRATAESRMFLACCSQRAARGRRGARLAEQLPSRTAAYKGAWDTGLSSAGVQPLHTGRDSTGRAWQTPAGRALPTGVAGLMPTPLSPKKTDRQGP